MIELTTPRGLPVSVPETVSEGPTIRFKPNQLTDILEYYENNGYVVVSNVIDMDICKELRRLWDSDVKSTQQYIYRQATAKAERHDFNENGWVMNPILNLQSLDPKTLGRFRDFATSKILTNNQIKDIFAKIFDDDVKVVQSMYFEGNSATWEHQDSYYLDSEVIGRMAAAWIAIEPIEASAGRFFICPQSHRLHLDAHGISNNIADNHEVYIESIVRKVRELELEIRAPRLEIGDVLFWNAWTIHGSLDSQHPNKSRSSVTCHAIPASQRFLQLQLRTLDVKTDDINGVKVYRPKDLALVKNRAVLWVESHFPKQFYWMKRTAIRRLARQAG